MRAFLAWLDDRTGYRQLVHEALYERIPGGARWRYAWGSTLVFCFATQVVTGLFLWMAYSPSQQTAWESVYYIQHEMQGGWLLRGVHHFMAQAMVVLMGLHLLQVVVDGAYRAPREINFWLGLVLMQIVLGLALTGYLLPWDQKGYWATKVATNLVGLAPGLGSAAQQLVVGGPTYGHHTLTRFFALHAGLLPGLLSVFLLLHVALFRRHGIKAKEPLRQPECTFWPDQVLKDAVACLAVLAVVLGCVLWPAWSGAWKLDLTRAGAELMAPADATNQYSAARPEWYFLFLYQLLKYFPGDLEWIGAIALPTVVLLVLALMPLVGRWKYGHGFNVVFLLALLLCGVVPLTVLAWQEDHRGPDSPAYLAAVDAAAADAERIVELAQSPSRIPPTGALALLRSDPKTEGRRLFEHKCAVCHGTPGSPPDGESARIGAPNLADFASRAWLSGLLNPAQIAGPKYFGNTAHFEGEMVDFVTGELLSWSQEEIASAVLALSAEAGLPRQAAADAHDATRIEAGRALIAGEDKCAQCHKFHEAGELGTAPDLTGYGSRQWIADFVHNPAHERFYAGDANDRMPAFGESGQLSPAQIGLIADYLRQDWFQPPATGAE